MEKSFLFRELETELRNEGLILSPLPSPNRVLKLCVSNCLAKTSILSIDGASFSFYGIKYRVIEKRVDSALHPSPNRVLKPCVSNYLAKTSILPIDGARFSF